MLPAAVKSHRNHFDANYELEHRLELKGKSKILGTVKDIVPKHVKITSVRQPDAKGLGHAILCARHILGDDPFAVLLPDVLVVDDASRDEHFSFSQLMASWELSGSGQIMVERVEKTAVESYGIVDIGPGPIEGFTSAEVQSLVEKPSQEEAPSDLAVLGRYILPSEVLDILEHSAPGVGGEIQLTDALDQLLLQHSMNALLTDAQIFDCGNKLGFIGANITIALRDPNSRDYISRLLNKAQGANGD